MSRDKALNLDFSGITRPSEGIQPSLLQPAVKVDPTGKIELPKTGITLTLEKDGGYYFKDLGDVNGTEFLSWAIGVLPGLSAESPNPKDFETRTSRTRAFEQILRFWKSSLFNPKGEKELLH